MAILLGTLLRSVPAEVEGRVKRARDRSRASLRDALRAESRLAMRGPDEGDERGMLAQVSVDIDPGHPLALKGVSFDDDLVALLLLTRYRSQLEAASEGALGLLELHRGLQRIPMAKDWTLQSDAALRDTHDWSAAMLEKLRNSDPVAKVLEVNEDVLGVYVYDSTNTSDSDVNRASIRLYWAVIGLVSEWLGCTVEDLTVVVLAHELAHAYTQLGADIDGRRWAPATFAATETDLKEGLAQYYTERAVQRLQARFPGALSAFRLLTSKQSEPYKRHLPWVDAYSPEAVRRAMLETRRNGEKTLEAFETRLERAGKAFSGAEDQD